MQFEKVSFEQYLKDFRENFLSKLISESEIESKPMFTNIPDDYVKKIYDDIQLPTRSTIGSAGYDFSIPIKLTIFKRRIIQLPTGIKWNAGDVKDHRYLTIYPRSSLGSKYFLREPNLVSIIDSDYYNCAKNEGHIFVNLCNEGPYTEINIQPNTGYAQGIISRYEITDDDNATGIREGGFGSTNR